MVTGLSLCSQDKPVAATDLSRVTLTRVPWHKGHQPALGFAPYPAPLPLPALVPRAGQTGPAWHAMARVQPTGAGWGQWHGVVATRRACGAKAPKGAEVCRTQSEEGWSCGRMELPGTCLSEPSWAWPYFIQEFSELLPCGSS